MGNGPRVIPEEKDDILVSWGEHRWYFQQKKFYEMPLHSLSPTVCFVAVNTSKHLFKGTEGERRAGPPPERVAGVSLN